MNDDDHEWVIEEVDGGSIGIELFWICSRCQASGGPAFYFEGVDEPQWQPFYADGSGLQLGGLSCAEAKQVIAAHTAAKGIT